MTYRIETSQGREAAALCFQGVLDRDALEAIVSGVATARANGARKVVLTLGVGTSADGECIRALRSVEGLTVRAASPFLAHWLAQDGVR